MKKLLVSALMLTSTFCYALSDKRCGMPENYPCNNFYSKFEAFKKLQSNENSLDDAKANLELVLSAQNKLNVNLEYATDNFIYIQKTLGGAGSTIEAQKIFSLLLQKSNTNNPLHELTTQFVLLNNAENSSDDARENFLLIYSYLNSDQVQINGGAAEFFLKVMKLEGGSGATLNARETFKMLMSLKDKYLLSDLFNSYERLLKTENGHDDAVGNFELVVRVADKCGDLFIATDDFIQVLSEAGGAGSTLEARDLYKMLYE